MPTRNKGERWGLSTMYRGSEMRSRLEARWALFFDSMGIHWQYEPTVFDTAAGKYVPDFRLEWPSGHALWAEVKPTEEVLTARDKARYACFSDSRVLLLLDGPPAARAYKKADALHSPGGIVLLDSGPQFVMTADGAPFDMAGVKAAATLAQRARFKSKT